VRLRWGAGAEGLAGIATTTDPWGRFSLDVDGELRPAMDAPVILEIDAPGFVSQTNMIENYPRRIGVAVQVKLERAGRIAGHVVDLQGRPVAGATVYVLPPDAPGMVSVEQVRATTSGTNGEFLINRLRPGRWRVGALHEGARPGFTNVHDVAAGERVEVGVISLAPGRRISGVVTTEAGEPIAGARVFAWQDPEHKLLGLPGPDAPRDDATTDEEGRFVFDQLAAGAYTVQAEKQGHKAAAAARHGVPTGRDDLVLTLVRPARIRLVVVDSASGRPVPEFTVSISPLVTNTHLHERADISSPAGTYDFGALPEERYHLEVVADGYDVFVIQVEPVEAGETRELRIPLVPR
jgi:protocatechuate 3,4-dioxygenase beta subunit